MDKYLCKIIVDSGTIEIDNGKIVYAPKKLGNFIGRTLDELKNGLKQQRLKLELTEVIAEEAEWKNICTQK